MYYSASLFQEIGFNQPTAVGLIISGTNFVFTLVALKFVFELKPYSDHAHGLFVGGSISWVGGGSCCGPPLG